MEKDRYFLALTLQKGRENLINIADLEISMHYAPQSLEEIDAFTMHYTKDEIMGAIEVSNIAPGFLDGTLCVLDKEEHKTHQLPALTKDYLGDFDLTTYLISILPNKNLMSNYLNKYMSLTTDDALKNATKEAIKNQDVAEIVRLFNELDYLGKRELIVYLITNMEKKDKKKKNPELKLDRAA